MKSYLWRKDVPALELHLTQSQVDRCSLGKPDDIDVLRVAADLGMARQLARIPTFALRDYLRSMGVWSPEELNDRVANLQRLIWSASLDVKANPEAYEA